MTWNSVVTWQITPKKMEDPLEVDKEGRGVSVWFVVQILPGYVKDAVSIILEKNEKQPGVVIQLQEVKRDLVLKFIENSLKSNFQAKMDLQIINIDK